MQALFNVWLVIQEKKNQSLLAWSHCGSKKHSQNSNPRPTAYNDRVFLEPGYLFWNLCGLGLVPISQLDKSVKKPAINSESCLLIKPTNCFYWFDQHFSCLLKSHKTKIRHKVLKPQHNSNFFFFFFPGMKPLEHCHSQWLGMKTVSPPWPFVHSFHFWENP